MKSKQMINFRNSVKNTDTEGRNIFSTTRTLEYRKSNVCVEFCNVNQNKTPDCVIILVFCARFRTTETSTYNEQVTEHSLIMNK